MKRILFIACILATLAFLANSTHDELTQQSPTPSVDCSQLVYDMFDCLHFLSEGSHTAKPSSSCCAGFESVVSIDPECICAVLNHTGGFGIAVNHARATTLSSSCGVSAPPLSKCGISIIPTIPASAPANPPESSPVPSTPPNIEPPTNNKPLTPTPTPSNSDDNEAPAPSNSDDNEGLGESPTIGQVPAQSPSKGTAYSISVCFLVLLASVVAYIFTI